MLHLRPGPLIVVAAFLTLYTSSGCISGGDLREGAARKQVALQPGTLEQVTFGAPCPPVLFRSAPQTRLAATRPVVMVAGLERQIDGSFTRRAFQVTQTGTQAEVLRPLDVIPNYEQELYRCSGFPAVPHQPGTVPALTEVQTGRPSSQYVFADFVGDGVFSAAGYNRRFAPNAVIVGRSGPNFTSVDDGDVYDLGGDPSGILAADFNGDDRLDLAVSYRGPIDRSTPGGVAVLLNNGNGAFAAPINTPLGDFANSITAADWNADGRMDLAVTESSPQRILVLAGQGDGAFGAPVTLADFATSQLAADDVNGDGRIDLIAPADRGFLYFPGLGAQAPGLSADEVNVDVGLGVMFSITAGDFNGDARTDVALGSLSNDYVAVTLNQGNGNFSQARAYRAGRNPESLTTLDFDNDGAMDLIVGGGHPAILGANVEADQFAVLRGHGDGVFDGMEVISPDAGPVAEAVADFDGDNVDDLITVADGDAVRFYRSRRDGTFADPVETVVLGARFADLAVGQFDNDADNDLASITTNGEVQILRGQGNGRFAAGGVRRAAGADSVIVGDFDGDMLDDVAAFGDTAVAVFAGAGDGTLGPRTAVPTGGNARFVDLAAADFDDDGRDDLVAVDQGQFSQRDGSVRVLMSGPGGFAPPILLTAGSSPRAALPVDFDGDGSLDLVVSAEKPQFEEALFVFIGDGNGRFTIAGEMPTEFGPGQMLATDLDSDNRSDLVVLHCCGNTDPTYLLGAGPGSFQPEVEFFAAPDPLSMSDGDFNNDGRRDLVIRSDPRFGGGVSVLINSSEDRDGPVHVSAASFFRGPLAPDMLVTAFGEAFASTSEAASVIPLPTTLAGTRITVTDSEGAIHDAALVFMSPGQANYWLPSDTAEGPATVTIQPAASPAVTQRIQVRRLAPGLFTLNADRLAAALILRVNTAGEQSIEQVFELSGEGTVVPREIDFGDSGDRLFLLIFGTGFRNHRGLFQLRLLVGGIGHSLDFAGDQGSFVGLDQANAELDRALIGAGEVDVRLEAEGLSSNIVRLRFR